MTDIFSDSMYRDLEKLNFSVNESKVYLTLIRLGPSFAGRIAKEAKLDRSSTYNALKMLIERGVISTVFENKRTIYSAADPARIMNYYKEKEEIATRIIPNLRAQFGASKEKKNIQLFKGYKGLKTLLGDILETLKPGEQYRILGSEGNFSERMPYFAPIFVRRKKEKRIRSKILVRSGRKVEKHEGNEYREVKSDVVSPVTMNIYRGKVSIFVWAEEPEALLIENEKISETFKDYFEQLWQNAKVVK